MAYNMSVSLRQPGGVFFLEVKVHSPVQYCILTNKNVAITALNASVSGSS